MTQAELSLAGSSPARKAHPWFLAWTMFLAYAAAHLDRQIVTLLVEPMKQDLKFTDEQIGALIGFAFAISYTFCSLPVGYLADRLGRRKVLGWGVLFWSLMTALCGLFKTFPLLGLARVGVGVGEAVVTSTTLPMVASSFPPERRSFPMALCVCGAGVGGALALILGGLIVQATEHMPTVFLPVIGAFHPWQSAFLVAGGFGVIVLCMLAFVREPPRPAATATPMRFGDAFRYFWARPGTYASVFLAPAFFLTATMGMLAWMPANLHRAFKMEQGQIGLYVGIIMFFTSTSGVMLAGAMGHWTSRARSPALMQVVTLCCAAGAGLLYVCSTAIGASPIVSIALFGVGQILGGAVMALPMMAIQNVTPAIYRSQATAVFTFCCSLVGSGLGPLIIGTLTTRVLGDESLGLAMALTVGGSVSVVVLIIALGLRSFTRESSQAAEEDRLAAAAA